jgi:ribosome-associated protein
VKTIKDVIVERVPITLGQFVKVATAISGGEAKRLIQGGSVLVNGVVEVRRSRKLADGDEVRIEGFENYRLVTSPRGE